MARWLVWGQKTPDHLKIYNIIGELSNVIKITIIQKNMLWKKGALIIQNTMMYL